MTYRFAPFKKEFLRPSAAMIPGTWTFHEKLRNCDDSVSCYATIIQRALLYSEYTDVALDEKNQVLGYLFGGSNRMTWRKQLANMWFNCKIFCNWQLGRFGHRRTAYNALKEFEKSYFSVIRDWKEFDNELILFFVASKARGRGLGRTLMERYIKYCQRQNYKSIILMTDTNSNFGFYEHYGFKRHHAVYSSLLEKTEADGTNCFSYTYYLQ